MSNRIFVDNLPFTATEQTIRTLFAEHGEVHAVTLLTNGDGKTPRGAAFVEMPSDAAASAIDALDGFDLDGRNLRVIASLDRGRAH